MHVELWPIDRPIPYENNPRTISPEGLLKIANSIREFGWRQPVVVDEAGIVLVGHTRLRAAREVLGLSEVPVHVAVGLTPEQAAAYRLADNRTNEEAQWVTHQLADEIARLASVEGFDVGAMTGFGVDEINRLLTSNDVRERAEEAPPLVAKAISREGDVWCMGGGHRVICGDSTSEAALAALLNGAKPHLMVTDPPYGVNYDAAWRNNVIREDGSVVGARATGKVLNDDRADWRDVWRIVPAHVAYIWHAGSQAHVVADSLIACGFKVRAQIIWAKPRFAIGRGDYHQQHEPCLYASKSPNDHWQDRFETEHELALYAVKGSKPGGYRGGRKQSTVWQIEHRKSETGHSTQKPIECMQRPIENNSKPGDAVLDPFLGSGTTLMAAELSGRLCYGVELNPGYVDVICRRWRHAFQSEPVLEATGQTFAQVEAERSVEPVLEAAE